MATIKSYTDISQSKKLLEILPIESADMYWWSSGKRYYIEAMDDGDFNEEEGHICAWSIAALSEFILPYIADDDGNNYKFYLSKDGLDRWIAYYKSDDVSIHICEESDNMIDVILEMVCWLKKRRIYLVMKSYTDLEQSKVLATILPLESADMNYWCGTQIRIGGHRTMDKDLDVPCWSLSALLGVLPEIQGGKPSISLDDNYITYPHMSDLHTKADNLVDACYEMILKLHELNLL